MTICVICNKRIINGQSFSCAICGTDEQGRFEVEHTHLDCGCERGLTDWQKEKYKNRNN